MVVTVEDARAVAGTGVDAIVAQGGEAGGHRSTWIKPASREAANVGTMVLVAQVADAVKQPVIAAGGIADGRGIAAAFALGAAGVQIGTAFLHCPESKISKPHRAALSKSRDDATALTNVMSGRPGRGIVNRLMREVGPMSDLAPAFPRAAAALAPLRAAAEKQGSGDFSPMWSGQAAALGREEPAGELTRRLAAEALARMRMFAT
jgi:nitronate monooxygenase